MSASPDIRYYPRGSDRLARETVLGGGLIARAYRRADAGLLRRLAFRSPLLSRVLGWFMDSPLSRGRIRSTIARLDIDESEFRDPVESFRSFNDFFTRHLKPAARPFSDDPDDLLSPADARTLVYPRLDGSRALPVKGAVWSVDDLLGRPAPEYRDGAAAVFRLCPADYHRFHFPAAGTVVEARDIPGTYESVNPLSLALGLNVFCENKRAVTVLETARWGRLALVEVGAFGVGSIVQTYAGPGVGRLAEKGLFQFGGSTVILVAEPGRVEFSADLVAHSAAGYETLVLVGQTIGRPGPKLPATNVAAGAGQTPG